MSLLFYILDIDSISYEVYGFWGCLRRRIYRALPWQLTKWWENHVRTIYAPQHSSLRAAIPKTWCDLDEVIASFLYACVISFVENEDGLEDWEQPYQEGPRKEQAAMLREVYEWAKTGRTGVWEKAFTSVPPHKGLFGGDYTEYRRITEEIETKDQRYLAWVVQYREYMWS